jgi:hypothetical protein
MPEFFLMIAIPVIVGFVIYKVINYNHESWQKECDRMGDDIF